MNVVNFDSRLNLDTKKFKEQRENNEKFMSKVHYAAGPFSQSTSNENALEMQHLKYKLKVSISADSGANIWR